MYLMLLGVFCSVSFVGTQVLRPGIQPSDQKRAALYEFDPLKELFVLIDSQIKRDNVFTFPEFELMAKKLGSSDTITAEELAVSLEKLRKGLGVMAPYFVTCINTEDFTLSILFDLNYEREVNDYCSYAEFVEDYTKWKRGLELGG